MGSSAKKAPYCQGLEVQFHFGGTELTSILHPIRKMSYRKLIKLQAEKLLENGPLNGIQCGAKKKELLIITLRGRGRASYPFLSCWREHRSSDVGPHPHSPETSPPCMTWSYCGWLRPTATKYPRYPLNRNYPRYLHSKYIGPTAHQKR